MAIGASTFITDTIKLVRDQLNTAITDPIAASRSGRDRFVMTSYPQRPVKYPIITVTEDGFDQDRQLGMKSEATEITFPIEIRVWAKNVKQKDSLAQEVYDFMRTNQIEGSNKWVDEGLFDFNMTTSTNIDEDGNNAIKSKIMTYTFHIILTG
jgi:hypothetical protein